MKALLRSDTPAHGNASARNRMRVSSWAFQNAFALTMPYIETFIQQVYCDIKLIAISF